MKLHRATKYRLYPTPEQAARLDRWEGALRFLWNLCHEQRQLCAEQRCRAHRVYPSAVEMQRDLAPLRAELPWLADVPRSACEVVVVAYDLAWQRCWKGLGGAPQWKSKHKGDGVGITEAHSGNVSVSGDKRTGTVTFPKLGPCRAVVHRPPPGRILRVTLKRDGADWYASVLCEVEVADPAPSTLPPVGLDRGVVALVADSNGVLVPNPRHGKAMAPRIAKAQRVVSRKVKGSKNQQKARAKVAKLQRKVKRQREHALHNLSLDYAKNHGMVAVEALRVQQMTASAKGTVEDPGVNVAAKSGLNRSILDAGWGRLVELLRYKLAERGGHIVEVPAAYSSQTCGACGHVDPESRSSQATFACTACGHSSNADTNAARVILARGLAIGANAPKVVTKLKTVRRKAA